MATSGLKAGAGEFAGEKTGERAGVRAWTRATPYIASPWYDWIFFLSPPLVALALGIAISNAWVAGGTVNLFDRDYRPSALFIGIFIHAHLFVVFFRSHGNTQIFKLYPLRFLLVPVALYAAMISSLWILVAVSVLATFWDVYHSSLQTFGFARIYDGRAANQPHAGRRLDWGLNLLMYAGPIVAGATMMDHFKSFSEFEDVGSVLFSSIPAFMQTNQVYFTRGILAAGTLYLLYYIFAYTRMSREGYRIPFQKVFLLASTGYCSIYTWGFNSFGEAFFIMNFFHALQYFGIVWVSERKSMMRIFRTASLPWAKLVTLLLFLTVAFGYGLLAETVDASVTWWWALTLVVSIMHFWYDGFIWSVRRKQV